MPNTNNSKQHNPESLAADSQIPEILPPTDDWVFKLLFGDKRNESMLTDLLRSFVELPDEEFELIFLDTHLKPEAADDKLGILDVKVQTKTGKIINIEIQVNPKKNIGKRISFYKSKLVVGQISKGKNYNTIQKVLCICITNYTLFPNTKEYLNKFVFMNPENDLLFEDIPEVVYTLEASKLPAQSDGNALWGWLQFLRATTKEEFEMIASRSAEIRKAADLLYTLSSDEETRAQYEAYEKAWRDRMAEIDYAYDDGMEKGASQAQERFVRNLAVMGMPMEEIAQAAELPVEQVRALAEKDAQP